MNASTMQQLAIERPGLLQWRECPYLGDEVALPLRDLYFKGITFKTGRPNVRPQMEQVLRLCHAGRFNPHDVPATVFAFDQAADAWLSKDLRTAVSRLHGA